MDPDADGDSNLEVYVSVYTDEHSKVFEISDFPSVHIFETDRSKNKGEEEAKEGVMIESLQSSFANQSLAADASHVKEEDEEENRTALSIR